MTHREFEQLVQDILDKFPKRFSDKFSNLEFVIEDEPDINIINKFGLSGKGRLLGLYQGVPLKNRSVYYGMVLPDKITLFKQNIERICKAQKINLRDEVKHVIQHEIAHHFGFSDDDLKKEGVY